MQSSAGDQQEFVEPSNAARVKVGALLLTLLAIVESIRYWLAPVFMAHINTLPKCQQLIWLTNALQLAFFILPVVASAFVLPSAAKMLKQKIFPLPGAWIISRTKVQRGRIVVARAYVLIALCLLMFTAPIWARYILNKSDFYEACKHNNASQIQQ